MPCLLLLVFFESKEVKMMLGSLFLIFSIWCFQGSLLIRIMIAGFYMNSYSMYLYFWTFLIYCLFSCKIIWSIFILRAFYSLYSAEMMKFSPSFNCFFKFKSFLTSFNGLSLSFSYTIGLALAQHLCCFLCDGWFVVSKK